MASNKKARDSRHGAGCSGMPEKLKTEISRVCAYRFLEEVLRATCLLSETRKKGSENFAAILPPMAKYIQVKWLISKGLKNRQQKTHQP